jgi:hypothetical protein
MAAFFVDDLPVRSQIIPASIQRLITINNNVRQRIYNPGIKADTFVKQRPILLFIGSR